MASMTIRNLDDGLKRRLRIQAAEHGTSMEEEAREILRAALSKENPEPYNLSRRIRERFAEAGGIDLELPAREPLRQPPDLVP
ncbi:MAG: plasmid stabilization protein [Gemmatimonadetes bacterium]|jgi:antitoxin FitA|nr:plasmid stabilization protein [Gemmatimonadota bacterium]MBT6148906.1 plasmid stabilization protein [Gemmatimonadota bacterium]MBT7863564.1 plasmid stabilization protein [Gemmatimonadota bacterium]